MDAWAAVVVVVVVAVVAAASDDTVSFSDKDGREGGIWERVSVLHCIAFCFFSFRVF